MSFSDKERIDREERFIAKLLAQSKLKNSIVIKNPEASKKTTAVVVVVGGDGGRRTPPPPPVIEKKEEWTDKDKAFIEKLKTANGDKAEVVYKRLKQNFGDDVQQYINDYDKMLTKIFGDTRTRKPYMANIARFGSGDVVFDVRNLKIGTIRKLDSTKTEAEEQQKSRNAEAYVFYHYDIIYEDGTFNTSQTEDYLIRLMK